MGFSGLAIATSGIRAAQTNLAVTGHNISNAEIPGFSRQRVVQTTAFVRNVAINHAGERLRVGHGTDWNAVQQIRNEFLDFSYRQNVGRLQFYSTVVQAGLVVESLLGEMHGAYSFQSVLNDMWYSIQELSSHTDGIAQRNLFIATVNSFLNKAQEVYRGLVEYQHNLDAQIREMVMEINELVSNVDRLNLQIRNAEAAGDNANDFRDERHRVLDRLAELIPLDAFTAPNGDVQLLSQGHELLANGRQNLLGFRFISDEFSFVEPVFTTSRDILSAGTPPTDFRSFTNYSVPMNSANRNDQGALNALLMARGTAPANRLSPDVPAPAYPGISPRTGIAYTGLDDPILLADQHNWRAHQWSINNAMIPQVQMNLDRIVFSVVNILNDAVMGNLRDVNDDVFFADEGPPLDMHGNEGIPIFIRNMNENDTTFTWPVTDENASFVNTILTITNLQVNPALLGRDGHNFLALSVTGGEFDNRLVLAMQEMWSSADPDSPYAVNINNRYFNVQDAYIFFTGTIATEISEANSFVASQTVQVIQADNLRNAIKGVSMDEELNAMLRFQFAFQAASRVFNVIDAMIEQVLMRMF